MKVVIVDKCPCCRAQQFNWVIRRDQTIVNRFLILSREKYGGLMDGWECLLSLDVAQCGQCGHIWHHMQPDQTALFEMYAQSKRRKGDTVTPPPTRRMRMTMRGFYRYCVTGYGKRSFLDFGSGSGRWAVAARAAGFQVTAYEPTTSRQDQTSAVEFVDSLSLLNGRRFDLVNLEQVLEHIPDPAHTIRQLRQFCHKDTLIRISVPDILRFESGLKSDYPFNGKSVHILSPYEHLHGFCQASLKALMNTTGLEICSDWNLLLCLPSIYLKRLAISIGVPFGRTAVVAKFSNTGDLNAVDMKEI